MKFLIVLSIISLANCGLLQHEGRIIRGNDAQPNEFPFQVGIFIERTATSPEKFCGGTLVAKDTVLTAANCFKNPESGGLFEHVEMTVVLNATDIHDPNALRLKATEYVIHESFGLKSFENDIAYIKLNEKVELGAGIDIIRLPMLSDTHNKFENVETVTLGWGKPKSGWSGEIPVPNLRYLTANVISNTKCWAYFPGYLKDTNVCTDIKIGTPCDGDEGGPLLMREADGQLTQIGIFSYQFSLLCDSIHPAVFTRISKYLNWIESHAGIDLRW